MAQLVGHLRQRETNFAEVLGKRIPVRLFEAAIISVYMKLPALHECTAESQRLAWEMAAVLGQIPGIDVHWIPFNDNKTGKKNLTSVTDYRDMTRKAMDSGKVSDIYAEVVYKDDAFEIIRGTDPKIIHKPALKGSRKVEDITVVYMVAQMIGSDKPHFDYMTIEEVRRIQDLSKAGHDSRGPWVNHFVEQAKKTVLKRGCKVLPRTLFPPEYLAQIQKEDAAEFDFDHARNIDSEMGGLPFGEEPALPATPSDAAPSAPAQVTPTAADLRTRIQRASKDRNPEQVDAILFKAGIESTVNECADVAILTAAAEALEAAQP